MSVPRESSHRAFAAESRLTDLRRRNIAFAAKLQPVIERLRELLPERIELARLNDAAAVEARRAANRDDWLATGEERFWKTTARVAPADVLGELRDLAVRLLEEPEASEDDRRPEPQVAGWIPSGEDVVRAATDGQVWHLRTESEHLRSAVSHAVLASRSVFGEVAKVYAPIDDSGPRVAARGRGPPRARPAPRHAGIRGGASVT